ncbi:MAG: MerR family transcriptional regulator [Clostridia bacterium]|nr:MerR family transcriptional regulator [Clostridia bacterium]
MKINDVEKITGLTQKAIRLYESKGLINIAREKNGYRNYTSENIDILKKIKLLRSVGVSIADIKLYVFGVLTLNEMMNKRKSEILKESGINSENYRICERLSKGVDVGELKNEEIFTENEELRAVDHGMLSVGIDIGTTTVSAVVYDIDNKEQLEAYTVPHHSYVRSDTYSEQSTSVIMDKAEKLLYHILKCYKNIISIGLSGQMHGIVYNDADGNPVSNLINWQDKRADEPIANGKTTCDLIRLITGERIATGYGIATHYYNMNNASVPEKAAGFCSIMDLFGMKICGLNKAITHASVAASFGLFDIKKGEFLLDKLSLLGIDGDFLPSVTAKSQRIGTCRGIPVAVALGDNQASFLGSVSNHQSSALVNIGTGSQISAVSEYREPTAEIEIRPFLEGKYLACGSALCGGYAYSMVEAFFRDYMVSAGMQDVSQYKMINQLACDAYEKGEKGLDVNVSFFGKRSDPAKRGSIKMIDRENFTPSALVLGVLRGICNELYELYEGFEEKKTNIVASGGGVRKNEVLKKLIEDRFGASVSVNAIHEEAATGAALFSAFVAGKIKYNNGFSEYITYI